MYDEGDCCGTCANMEQCSDCQCLEGSPINNACKLEQCKKLKIIAITNYELDVVLLTPYFNLLLCYLILY